MDIFNHSYNIKIKFAGIDKSQRNPGAIMSDSFKRDIGCETARPISSSCHVMEVPYIRAIDPSAIKVFGLYMYIIRWWQSSSWRVKETLYISCYRGTPLDESSQEHHQSQREFAHLKKKETKAGGSITQTCV